ncbi:MAG: PilZ domain-containing protein [Myxococcota bacterium]
MDERRGAPRAHSVGSARLRIGCEDGSAHIVDISPFGLQLRSPLRFERQQSYTFTAADQTGLTFHALCRWCRRAPDRTDFEAGFEFLNIGPVEVRALIAYALGRDQRIPRHQLARP